MALSSFLYDLQRGAADAENRKRRRDQIVLPTGEVLTGAQAENYRKLQLLQAQGEIDKSIQESKNQGLLGATGMEGQTARDVAGLRNKGLLSQTEMEGANRLKAIGLEGKYSIDRQRAANEGAASVAGIQTGSAEQIAVLNALAGGKDKTGRFKDVKETLPDGSEVVRLYDTSTGQFVDQSQLSGNTGTFNAPGYIASRTGGQPATGLSQDNTYSTPKFQSVEEADRYAAQMRGEPFSSQLPGSVNTGLAQTRATRPTPLQPPASQTSPLVKPVQPPTPGTTDNTVKDVSREIQSRMSMSGLGPQTPYQPMVKPVVDIGGAMRGLKSTFYDQSVKALKDNLRILRNSKRK